MNDKHILTKTERRTFWACVALAIFVTFYLAVDKIDQQEAQINKLHMVCEVSK